MKFKSLTLTFWDAQPIRVTGIASYATTCGNVVENIAQGILTTSSRAGILTLLLLAGLVGGTVRVKDAFRAASLIGISKVLWQALARAGILARSTTGIDSTGAGIAGIKLIQLLNPLFGAESEWITLHTLGTDAAGSVGDDAADRRLSTKSWTRIAALLLYAGLACWALRASHTFGSAVWRSSNVVRQASAGRRLVDLTALGIWSARRGQTCLPWRRYWRFNDQLAAHEGISSVAL